MSFASELVAQREAIKEADYQEKVSYGARVFRKTKDGIPSNLATKNVPQELARKTPVLEGLGKIQRRKTEDANRFELLSNGEVIGEAIKTQVTVAQRYFTVTINGVTVDKVKTINMGIRKIGEQS